MAELRFSDDSGTLRPSPASAEMDGTTLAQDYLYIPEQLAILPRKDLGGKVRGLMTLRAAGLPVPPFLVLPADIAKDRPWRESPEARTALESAFKLLSRPPFSGVAVRSSAAFEDSASASYAGLFRTVFAESPQELPERMEQVLDSARGLEVLAYSGGTPPPMAVILQARVEARLAGVLFSADPVRARLDEAYLEVVHGAGAGLVDGTLEPSKWRIDLASRKVRAVSAGPDGPDELPDGLLDALLSALIPLETRCRAALDIEWAYDGEGLWFLQARPITALTTDPSLRPSECVTSWFFDQRFAEPIRPLTRTTLLSLVSRIGLQEALSLRGRASRDLLFYFYGGQAYVPHHLYREMFAGAPGWLLSADLRQLFPEDCACAQTGPPSGSFLNYLACAIRAGFLHWYEGLLTIPAWHSFQSALPDQLSGPLPVGDATEPEWRAAWEVLDELNARFLRIHRWSLLWADYAYRAFRLIRAVLPRGVGQRLEQQLDTGSGLITTHANAALYQLLTGPEDAAALDEFIARFGHRSASLDYATPCWGELAASGALRDLYPALGELPAPPRLPFSLGRTLIAGLLFPLRRLLEMREEQRFGWERILARQRKMLLEAGKALARRGLLEDTEEVWFLEWSELLEALFHRKGVPRETIRIRRHTFWIESLIEKPLFLGPEEIPTPAAGGMLIGAGASAGKVRGKALVLRSPVEIPAGLDENTIAVLVSLDPAWTPLLAQVRGLVIERGGLLSHAAILAREYRVPLVIGVQNATKRLKTGMEIEIDGNLGHVREV